MEQCQEKATQSDSPASAEEPKAPSVLPPAAGMGRSEGDLKKIMARRAAVKRWADKNREHLARTSKIYRELNREKILTRQKKYNQSHKPEIAKLNRDWRTKNAARRKQYTDKWWSDNAHKRKSYDARSRFLRRVKNLRPSIVEVAVLPIIAKWKSDPEFNCHYCLGKFKNSELTIDHMIPVSRGGNHTVDNICRSCNGCNISKRTKTPEEFVHRDYFKIP